MALNKSKRHFVLATIFDTMWSHVLSAQEWEGSQVEVILWVIS